MFWFKFLPAELSLMFLGVTLVILLGQFLADFFATIKKTKFSDHESKLYFVVFVLLLFGHTLPSFLIMGEITSKIPTDEYMGTFSWLQKNTPEEAIIFSIPEEGHFITYLGARKNVMDREYLGVKDVDIRFEDIKTIYTTSFKVETLRILNKYNSDYVLFSSKTKQEYNLTQMRTIDEKCFDLVYNTKEAQIFKRNKERCELKAI